jgi:hypothetical protein
MALGCGLGWRPPAAHPMDGLHLGVGPRDPAHEFFIHRGLIGGDEAHVHVRRIGIERGTFPIPLLRDAVLFPTSYMLSRDSTDPLHLGCNRSSPHPA